MPPESRVTGLRSAGTQLLDSPSVRAQSCLVRCSDGCGGAERSGVESERCRVGWRSGSERLSPFAHAAHLARLICGRTASDARRGSTTEDRLEPKYELWHISRHGAQNHMSVGVRGVAIDRIWLSTISILSSRLSTDPHWLFTLPSSTLCKISDAEMAGQHGATHLLTLLL